MGLALAHGHAAQAWPGVPTPLVGAAWGVLAAVLGAVTAAVWRAAARRATRPGDPVAALSRNPSARKLGRDHVAGQSVRLRPSLAELAGCLADGDVGLWLGRLKTPGGDGPDLYASWEETVLVFFGPRGGKTTSLAVPYVLSSPGAVVATSVKADLWAVTAETRAASGSGVWTFDPQAITAAGQRFWVNMHAGLASVEAAHRLAGHFVSRSTTPPSGTSGGRPRRN